MFLFALKRPAKPSETCSFASKNIVFVPNNIFAKATQFFFLTSNTEGFRDLAGLSSAEKKETAPKLVPYCFE